MQISDNSKTFEYFNEILMKLFSDKLIKFITVTTAHISISVVNEDILKTFWQQVNFYSMDNPPKKK